MVARGELGVNSRELGEKEKEKAGKERDERESRARGVASSVQRSPARCGIAAARMPTQPLVARLDRRV